MITICEKCNTKFDEEFLICPVCNPLFQKNNPIEKAKSITNSVKHPEHYTHGKIEAIDKILDSIEHPESYLQGNVLKYVIRYKHKEGLQDLEKAKVYLEWLIEEVEHGKYCHSLDATSGTA